MVTTALEGLLQTNVSGEMLVDIDCGERTNTTEYTARVVTVVTAFSEWLAQNVGIRVPFGIDVSDLPGVFVYLA